MSSLKDNFCRLIVTFLLILSSSLHADWPVPANPVTITVPTQNVGQYNMAYNPSGNALTVWTANNTVQSCYVDTSVSLAWSSPITITGTGSWGIPVVASNNVGNGICCFRDNTAINTKYSLYNGATHTWSSPAIASTELMSAVNALAIDSSGNAILAYKGVSSLIVNYVRYDAGTSTWSSPAALGPYVTGIGTSFQAYLAMTPAGDATCIWATGTYGTNAKYTSSKYSVGTNTWSSQVDIMSPTNQFIYLFNSFGMDNAGNCLAVWGISNGTNVLMYSAKSDAGSTAWSSPIAVTGLNTSSETPRSLSFDQTGKAMLVYTSGSPTLGVSALRYTYSTDTWATPGTLLSNPSFTANNASVASAATGNAVAAFVQSNGTNDLIYAANYSQGTNTWSTPLALSLPGANAGGPFIGISSSLLGNAIWFRPVSGFTVLQSAHQSLPTDPTTSTVTRSPSSVQADGVTTSTVTVTFKDVNNLPVQGHTASLTAGSGSSIISAPSGVSDVNGQVTFTVKDSVVENVTYTATDTTDSVTITQTATVSFVAKVTSASTSTVSASPVSVQADGIVTSTITVTLLNNNSVPVVGHTVTLAAGSGSSIISAASGPSNGSGVVTFTVKDSVVEGPITYTATDTTNSVIITQTAQVTFTALVTDAGTSTVSASPITVLADGVGTSTITVTLKNINSLPVQGHTVTLTAGSGSSIISAASGVSTASGVVTFTVKDSTIEGPITYTAQDTTDSITITQTAAVTFVLPETDPAASYAVASPTTVAADGVTPATITITLKDANGVPMVGHNVILTANSGSSVITGPSGPSDAQGQVFFTVTDSVVESVTYSAMDLDPVSLPNIVTVNFANFVPQGPSYFRGRVTHNRFATQTEILNTLYCGASPDVSAVGMRIYQNGAVIYARDSNESFELVLHDRKNVETYQLVSFNAGGVESAPITITLE